MTLTKAGLYSGYRMATVRVCNVVSKVTEDVTVKNTDDEVTVLNYPSGCDKVTIELGNNAITVLASELRDAIDKATGFVIPRF